MSARRFVLRGIEPTYLSSGDEAAFFHWLQSIPCVKGVSGELFDLIVEVESVRDSSLRELIALFSRWNAPHLLSALRVLRTRTNAEWFCDPKKYWHEAVFGTGQLETSPSPRKRGRAAPGAASASASGTTRRSADGAPPKSRGQVSVKARRASAAKPKKVKPKPEKGKR